MTRSKYAPSKKGETQALASLSGHFVPEMRAEWRSAMCGMQEMCYCKADPARVLGRWADKNPVPPWEWRKGK